MVKSTRRIATKTGHQTKAKLEQSARTVLYYKPFYVQKSSEQEKESCLCKFCLNMCLRFNELNNSLKDKDKKEDSMTKYFSNGCLCKLSEDGFLNLKCITGQCNVCIFSPLYDLSCFKDQGAVKFHQFVVEEYAYLSKKGEMKFGKQACRKLFFEPIQEFITKFDSKQSAYLLHRFEIKNDIFNWPQILSDTDLGYLFRQAYSENISCNPKYEPEDAHFSSKKTSLHCTMVYGCEEKPKYSYHISDNECHDSTFNLLVTKYLLEEFDDVKIFPLIRIKSDSIVVCMSLKPT